MFSDDAVPGIFHQLPAENLAGIQRGGEVVVADGEEDFLGGRHGFNSEAQDVRIGAAESSASFS
jgi:hypothetical protein